MLLVPSSTNRPHFLAMPAWLALAAACQKSPGVVAETGQYGGDPPSIPGLDLSTIPPPKADDDRYRGVFAALDGEWQGTFQIYINAEGQAAGPSQPTRIDRTAFKRAPFKLESTINVWQSYISETPFFQRVRIEDRLPAGKIVKSEGVNKVEGGRLWCLVKKPDDLVVHAGHLDGPHTIVWSRTRRSPLAIERFEERVAAQRYTIVGWGYYGNDDPTKAPRMYFEAEYTRPVR